MPNRLHKGQQTPPKAAGQWSPAKFKPDAPSSGAENTQKSRCPKLFEEYVGRLVSRALAGTEYRVSLQGGREYCLTAQDDGRRVFQTKPDILIWRGGAIVHIIDTKWKRISSRIDDPKQGVSQSDIYQMMAYAHLYRAPRLTLLYPHHGELSRGAGIQGQFWITDRATALETASIDVALDTDDQIVARLKELIDPLLTEDHSVLL